jgi:DNA-binding GntR family transcriptional regulator
VQAEMRLLHEATRDWVTAVANNQLAAIPPAISRVHTARVATEKALERGEYTLPRGGDLAAFAKQDEAFHDELVKLLRASRANDLPATTTQLGVVLEGCTACHQQYRF